VENINKILIEYFAFESVFQIGEKTPVETRSFCMSQKDYLKDSL